MADQISTTDLTAILNALTNLNTTIANYLDTFTTKSTRDVNSTRDFGTNTANGAYDKFNEAHLPGPSLDLNQYGDVISRNHELFTARMNRMNELNRMYDTLFFGAAKQMGALDETTVSKLNDVLQAANRGDDQAGTTDKLADEREGKYGNTIDNLQTKVLSAVDTLTALVNSMNIEKAK